MSLRYEKFGDHAVLISWRNEISEQTSCDIYFFNQKLQKLIGDIIVETVPCYCSLTVFFTKNLNFEHLIKLLKEVYLEKTETIIKSKTWQIPVCYDLKYGWDIEKLACDKNISIDQLIKLHSQTLYTVDFIGFLPGFPYLSGLNPQLHTSRLSQPRVKIPKGSVAIGGKQTGIYPIESPAGWHIIGQTNLSLFDAQNKQPCLLKPMDKIQFVPISIETFEHD